MSLLDFKSRSPERIGGVGSIPTHLRHFILKGDNPRQGIRHMGVIIGTAGHVDHGKTELIKALTHIDTDRLKEEKEREISIELGFAWIDLPKSGRVGIIDVPGHVRFLKNMLAGTGGVDVTLLVVAADEGIMPQTREHFEIMRLLGVGNMVVAVTKKDLVDEETIELVKGEIGEFLAGTPFAGCPVIITSSQAGDGLDELKEELDKVCAKLPPKPQIDISRLFVDRAFEMKGFGTVVTGTLVSGKISQDDQLFIYPRGIRTRVRGVQVHYERRREAWAGERVALNLAGVKRDQVRRGCVISGVEYLKPTKRVTISLEILPSVKVLKDWTRVRLYSGSAELFGRISLLGSNERRGGERTFAQIFLEQPHTFLVGDRFVLRNYSPLWLIGGGKILGTSSQRLKKTDRSILPQLEAIEIGGAEAAVLLELEDSPQREEQLLSKIGLSSMRLRKIINKLETEGKVITLNHYLIAKKAFTNLKKNILSLLHKYYEKHPLRLYMKRRELAQRLSLSKEVLNDLLPFIEELRCEEERVSLKGYKPQWKDEELTKRKAIEEEFLSSGFQPPKPEVNEIFKTLLEDGTIVKIGEDIFLHREMLRRGKEKVVALIRDRGEATISEIKDVLCTSRKYTLPFVQYLDSLGVTKRIGDKRVLAREE